MVNPVLRPGEYLGADFTKHQGMGRLISRLRNPYQEGKNVGLKDEELMEVHAFLRDLEEKITVLGIEFSLAITGVRNLFDIADSFRRARCGH